MAKLTEILKRDILDDVCLSLAASYPIYAYFLSDLNRRYCTEKEKEKIPEASIGRYKGTTMMELVVNKDYLMSLPEHQRPMLLMHNLLHIVFSHQFLAPIMPDDDVRAIATDMSINQIIREDTRIAKNNNGENIPLPETWVQENSFQPLVFPSGLGSVEYYNLLKDLKDKKEEEGSTGSPQLDALLDSNPGEGHEGMDEIGEGMSDAEQEFAKQQVENKIKEGIENSSSGIGSSSWLREAFPHLFTVTPPMVNWKHIIRQFVQSSISSSSRRTRKRPNKRYEDAPGNTTDYRSKILFSMDSSGSISDKELEEFHNEMHHLYKTGVEIDVHVWDAGPPKEYTYKGKPIIERVASGGTDTRYTIERANQRRRDLDGMIILTDGFVPPAPACNVPLLWVVTEGGSMDFSAANGKKIKMSGVNK